MAIRNIIQVGDATLRKKSFEVTDFGEKTHQLIDDMKDTLIKADGAGLAAVQVGVLRRIFIIKYDDVYYECINPKIVKQSGTQVDKEGCLSVRGKWGYVERPKKVTLECQDRFGNPYVIKATDFLAKAICHENDHLDGIIYTDKATGVEDD